MWPKTITAFLGGLLLSVSMMLSLYLLIPLAIDIKLLIGLLAGFSIWVAAMVYFYSFNNPKTSALRCGKFLLLSVAINSLLFWYQSPL
ncbi:MULTISPECIES: hypothetical protein [Shewanella]|uniref:Uncharacterized protein n=1 Tax=Shewanella fidelis TaxID=173509 RepID=A0AAW8NK30_9GAMM|nr:MULTISPECIES: hypothetical protein [Shewanella]MDR8522740.1 hypothetical protein [Shewanella fidelis]MDW4812355.1 hypothetical protein [Shewanella fidelis]MDW4815980.1 hypothetical protein [Shewanella fidelis]MDW4820596.1 hypothetical protein [Shewanella fidelis]MDW4824819.1 hypothetical protein [Shewanella fidelis]